QGEPEEVRETRRGAILGITVGMLERLRRLLQIVSATPASANATQDASPTSEANNEQTSEGKANAAAKLAPSREKAFRQYLDAVEKNPTQLNGATDREVYDWLVKHQEAGENLPHSDSWCRYLREAREFYLAQKNTPRAGRPTGKSVVRQDQIERSERD